MKVVLTKDLKKSNEKTIKKGTQINLYSTFAQKLIDAKEARPLNLVERAVVKYQAKKETAVLDNEDKEGK